MDESGLVTVLKDRVSKLVFDIVDEDFSANDDALKRFNSININWVSSPPEKIRVISIAGVETVIAPSGYTVTLSGGYITFNVARLSTDTVRGDYSYFPFTDAQLLSIIQAARKQVQTLLFRTIDAALIAEAYQEPILKKAYVLVLREMQFPTTKYFTISVGGVSIGKENQVAMITGMVDSLEKELLPEINALRYFDRTNILT